MRVLIMGFGYVGELAGFTLAREGHQVFGFRRRSTGYSKALEGNGIVPLVGDVTDPASLARLPGPFDWVVNTVSAGAPVGAPIYHKVYVDGTRNLLDWLHGTEVQKFVYTSSTGVYGQDDGSVVDESSPTEPESETGKILVAAERLLADAARERQFPAVILRVAGIYGPGRGYWLKQYLKGQAVLDGTGQRWLNMIHLEDVVGCVLAALKSGRPGEVYNAVDDEPVTQRAMFEWLAKTLDTPMPPEAQEPAARARGASSKRVSNRKLKTELGYRLVFPTFREGFTAELARAAKAKELKA